jgi:hypothetical protein
MISTLSSSGTISGVGSGQEDRTVSGAGDERIGLISKFSGK